jgi:hypothetical protein
VDSRVKAYLADMEVDQYWIDRMFSANSQEYYMPPWFEADSKLHHLMDMVPSLEEVVLSKCKEDPDVDRKVQAFGASGSGPLTDADVKKMKEITREADVFYECEKTVLSAMQNAAFERENEPVLTAKCGPNRQCRADTIFEFSIGAINRWTQEQGERRPKRPPPVAEDFDGRGLSAADMAKRGKDAYKAQRWDVAARWFRMAADLGDADGMMGMTRIYGSGKGVPENKAEALRWLRIAADHGNTDAMESLGYECENGGKGVAAMTSLGYDCEDGGKGPTQDYEQAMRWYRKAADMGSAKAMIHVGELYDSGHGVPADYSEAMRWFRKAADKGDGFAMVQISYLYQLGHGVPKDEEQARQWMKRAVTSGDDIAQVVANQRLVDHPSP